MAVQTAPARRKAQRTHAVTAGGDGSVDAESAAVGERGPSLERAIGWVLVSLGFLIGSRAISDNSFFTHLSTGNLILDERSVPTTDVFSFTAAGEPWTVQS